MVTLGLSWNNGNSSWFGSMNSYEREHVTIFKKNMLPHKIIQSLFIMLGENAMYVRFCLKFCDYSSWIICQCYEKDLNIDYYSLIIYKKKK